MWIKTVRAPVFTSVPLTLKGFEAPGDTSEVTFYVGGLLF